MAATLYSTILMGILLLAIAGWIVRGRSWRGYKPEQFTAVLPVTEERPSMDPITAFFVVLIVAAAIGAATVFALGTSDPIVTATAFFAPMVLSYLIAGVYLATKGRTGSSAGAVATTAVVLGGVLLVAVVAKLLAGV